jgi:hypothetical protein
MESRVTVRFTPPAASFVIDHGRRVFIWSAEFARKRWERLRVSIDRPDAIAQFLPLGSVDGCSVQVSAELHAQQEIALPILVKLNRFPQRHLSAVNDSLADG